MNILIINYEYPPIGAGGSTAARNLALHLHRQGHRVAVLTSAFGGNKGTIEEDGVTVVRIPAVRRRADRCTMAEMGTYVVCAAVHLPGVVRRFEVSHAIVFFSLPCGPLGLYLKSRWGIPYVVSLRGGDVPGAERTIGPVHRILAPVRRAVLRRATAVVANSDGLRQMSEKVDPFPVSVIPNGVDTEFYAPSCGPRECGVFRALFVGRFQDQKNLFYLLRSAATAHAAGKGALELHLVGDGPQRRKLEQFAEGLGIKQIVSWHGWVDRQTLRSVYQAAGCLLNPSLYEGMPNAVLEAMACGLPVIASRVAGNRDVIADGETGLLIDIADDNALSSAIVRLMTEPALCRELGRKAREQVDSRFSWETVARRYMHAMGQ